MRSDAGRTRLVGHLEVSRETHSALVAYADRLVAENARQNLVSRGTLDTLWERHIVDSAQLKDLVDGRALDIGSGAGLPGMVLAILGADMTLVEPRRLRASFLSRLASEMKLDVDVRVSAVERVEAPAFDTITARAYAPLCRIFESALHLSDPATRWVLPKGRTGMSELESVRGAWHGEFRTLPSITDPEAVIVIAEGVRPKAKR